MQKVLGFLSHLHAISTINSEHRRIISKFIHWNLLIVKFLTAVVCTTAVACIFIPLSIFLITGRMEPILPPHIPFVPTDQLWGYTIHCIYFIGVIVTAYAGTIANELYLLTATMHIWQMYKILDQSINGLNQATGSLRIEAVKNSSWLHWRVRNIVLMHKMIYM